MLVIKCDSAWSWDVSEKFVQVIFTFKKKFYTIVFPLSLIFTRRKVEFRKKSQFLVQFLSNCITMCCRYINESTFPVACLCNWKLFEKIDEVIFLIFRSFVGFKEKLLRLLLFENSLKFQKNVLLAISSISFKTISTGFFVVLTLIDVGKRKLKKNCTIHRAEKKKRRILGQRKSFVKNNRHLKILKIH